MSRAPLARLAAVAVIVTVAVVGLASGWRAAASLDAKARAQEQEIAILKLRVASIESKQPNDVDWSAVAAEVEPSVFTIDTGDALGSAWVAHAGAGGSDLVTNYHVVADAYTAGTSSVQVRHKDTTFSGTIVKVDPTDDLAVIHVTQRLIPLAAVAVRPKVGARVMAVGSPLGLDGTISVGVVSGYRSLDGSDWMQFSAPISPGSSGGPVVDEQGHVLAVASAKLIGTGVEALSLGIPVQTACGGLVTCSL